MHIQCRYFLRKNLATGGVESPPQMLLTVKVETCLKQTGNFALCQSKSHQTNLSKADTCLKLTQYLKVSPLNRFHCLCKFEVSSKIPMISNLLSIRYLKTLTMQRLEFLIRTIIFIHVVIYLPIKIERHVLTRVDHC